MSETPQPTCPCVLFARATEWAALAGARWLGRDDQDAAETAQRGCRKDSLARTPDADREVVVRAADRGGDRRRHVAVLNQLDPSARGADLLDQVVVTRPFEHDRRDVVHVAPERVRDRGDVLGHRA